MQLGEVLLGPRTPGASFTSPPLSFSSRPRPRAGTGGRNVPHSEGSVFCQDCRVSRTKASFLLAQRRGRGGENRPVQFSIPARAGESQLGRGCGLKNKNYSLAFLHCGKQKLARSHQRLFSSLRTLSIPARLACLGGLGAGSLAFLPHNSHRNTWTQARPGVRPSQPFAQRHQPRGCWPHSSAPKPERHSSSAGGK